MARELNFAVVIRATETTIGDLRGRARMATAHDNKSWSWEWRGMLAEFRFETEDQAAIFRVLNRLTPRE